MQTLVLTVIGDDRAGLVQGLADTITAQKGSWQNSQLAHLAGKFAGIVEVEVSEERVDGLVAAVRQLPDLVVDVHTGTADAADPDAASISIAVMGNDRPGIVAEVSAALAGLGLNVELLSTGVQEAPMAGGVLFACQIEAVLPAGVSPDDVQAALEGLAGELMVDIDAS